ncbi:unnamed protein product [Rhodiola kirilowii]
MSLSELYRLAKGKQHKSPQHGAAACLAEPSSLPGSDFAELVWENGPVVMQGQLSRLKKHNSNNISLQDLPQNSRCKDKAFEKGDNSEMTLGRLGVMPMETVLNDFHIPVPSELDDMVPWLSYHMDEHVQHNYRSEFFTELSDVTATLTPLDKRSYNVRAIKDSRPTSPQNPAGFERLDLLSARPKVNQLDQLSSRQTQCSVPSFRSKASDINSSCIKNTTENLLIGDSAQKHCPPSSVYPSMKTQTQEPGQRSSIMNFSHFSKHALVVKSSLDTINAKACPEVSVAEQIDGKNKGSVRTALKPADPSQVASISAQFKADVSPRQALVPNGHDATGNVEKAAEPVIASSVCSGNNIERASNDPIFCSKRKYHESEDSEYPSEDVEEESVGIKNAATNRVGSGSKRSRAAEVHNLSERRRRDRINEKMRALQELIPHCNKVDKASMLDEAIEYLKTLQLQVQMMSMGSGLCMPPMMFTHAAHMSRFSPMSVGIGMGMGMGMGFPITPVPAPLPNLPMFSFQGQGHVAMPMSCASATSYLASPPSRPLMDLNTISPACPIGNLCAAQTSQSHDAVPNGLLTRAHIDN